MTDLDCTKCGACCVEAGGVHVTPENTTPRYLTHSVRRRIGFAQGEADDGIRCMKKHMGKRCVALRGVIGTDVRCSVYARRPEVCRQFEPGSDGCLESRSIMQHRLTKMDWKPCGYGPNPRDGEW